MLSVCWFTMQIVLRMSNNAGQTQEHHTHNHSAVSHTHQSINNLNKNGVTFPMQLESW